MHASIVWFGRGMMGVAAKCLALWGLCTPSVAGAHDDAHRTTYLIRFREPAAAEREIVGVSGKQRSHVHTERARAFAAHVARLDAQQSTFVDRARPVIGRALAPRFRYRYVASGMAVDLTEAEARALQDDPDIWSIEPDSHAYTLTDAGPAWIGADALWAGAVPGSTTRTKGEGIVVGVIDVGINAGHPAFADAGADGFDHANPRGRRYGLCSTQPSRCNDKLIGIYDFTDEGARDGLDSEGHGSHVAGIAVGNVIDASLVGQSAAVPVHMSGVAPHANLISYKACYRAENAGVGRAPTLCKLSALYAALDQAVADVVDVVVYSIGDFRAYANPWATLRDAGLSQSEVMLNVRAGGVLPVVAAGNEGPVAGSVVSPANAPWVVAVANSTHNRRLRNSVAIANGAGAPLVFDGLGLSGALADAPLVDAAAFGFPGCGTGADLDFPPTGASNPWPAGTFHGEIVLCQRGVQARVAKGYNVKLAGGGGMVVYNRAAEAESIFSDDHYLPAVHVGAAAGATLVGSVAAATASGANLRASISGTQRTLDGVGDVLNVTSARGPVGWFGSWLKPNVAAPGTAILSATPTGSEVAFRTGTSMSTPHVAGAAALLLAAHPSWSVDQVESALLTTARAALVRDDGAPAAVLDAGAGRLDLRAADRAGLYFATPRSAFAAADPAVGGDPRTLNLSSIADPHCFERCEFERTVSDMGTGGSWRVEVDAVDGATIAVTPATFSLRPGASQPLSISVDVSDARLTGRWIDGRVRLVPADGTMSATAVPVTVFSDPGVLPQSIDLPVDADAGTLHVQYGGLVPLANPALHLSDLVPLHEQTTTLAEDATSSDPFDIGASATYFALVALPALAPGQDTAAHEALVYAYIASTTSLDLDLHVGVDRNDDGLPEVSETVCRDNSGAAGGRCVQRVRVPAGTRNFWVLVQNIHRRAQSGGDNVSVEYGAAFDYRVETPARAAIGRMRAVAPGRVASRSQFAIDFQYDLPGVRGNDRWLAFLTPVRTAAAPAGFGDVAVRVPVAPVIQRRGRLLDARGDQVHLRLAAHEAHEYLAVDVPAETTSLTVTSNGTGEVDLFLSPGRMDPAQSAVTAAPPLAQALASSTQMGATEATSLARTGSDTTRYYVTPVNTGAQTAEVDLEVHITTSAAASEPQANAYLNPARAGHGVFLSQSATDWVLFWYTYDADRQPTWYYAQGPRPNAGAGGWSAPLMRYTWDGVTGAGTDLGLVTLTFGDADRFQFAWRLAGESGAEPMVAVASSACTAIGGIATDVGGPWYPPAHPGYGYSIAVFPQTELQVAYLYDASGNPRWLLGQGTPGDAGFSLVQYAGFCPLCQAAAVAGSNVGTVTRRYGGAASANHAVLADFASPLTGAWRVDDATVKLTDGRVCAAP